MLRETFPSSAATIPFLVFARGRQKDKVRNVLITQERVCSFLPFSFSSLTFCLLSPSPHPQIFSLVVFASIVNEGYVNIGSERLYCVFNKNADACNYGVFVGLVGLLACSFFGLLDYKFSSISSIKDRKKAVMLEIGFSGEEVIGKSGHQTNWKSDTFLLLRW